MILLWGLLRDPPLTRVLAALARMGEPAVFVDQRSVLEHGLELTIESAVRGRLRMTSIELDLDSITAAYLRPYDAERIGVVARTPAGSRERLHAQSFNSALWLWAELTPAVVVNRPSAMARTASKPAQAHLIQRHGFRVPETLLTSDVDAVREFRGRHSEVIYKSISSIRSKVSRLTPGHEERLADITACPTQFQEHIRGDDFRAHVVGDAVFGCRITSAADDYRYGAAAGTPPSMDPSTFPPECEERLRSLARAVGLGLAGIDLRRSAAGDWYCFEVNGSPAYAFYDRHGQGIAEAIARHLAGAEMHA